MRRRAMSWSLGRTAASPGRPLPAPGSRLFWIASFTLLAHGVLIGAAWRVEAEAGRSPAGRLAMRLLRPSAARQPMAAPMPASAGVRRPTALASLAPRPKPAPAKPDPLPATEPQPAPPAPVAAAEAIVGIAFAPPRIAWAAPAATRWGGSAGTPRPAATSTPAMPLQIIQAMQAQQAREAGRAQIAEALQRTMAQAAPNPVDGHCALTTQPPTQLACDEDALAQALAPREAALSDLLGAYRSIEPRTSGLEIAAAQGRYAVSWRVDDALR